MSWTRLIRFIDDDGNEKFGEPCITNEQSLNDLLEQSELWAVELKGESLLSHMTRGNKVHVKAMIDLVRPSDVPIIRCIGLNYIKHSTKKMLGFCIMFA